MLFRVPFCASDVGLLGGLLPCDLAQAAVLLLAPLVRHCFEERGIDEAIKLIDVHSVHAILKPLIFGLMAPDRSFVLATLVGVAGVQCCQKNGKCQDRLRSVVVRKKGLFFPATALKRTRPTARQVNYRGGTISVGKAGRIVAKSAFCASAASLRRLIRPNWEGKLRAGVAMTSGF